LKPVVVGSIRLSESVSNSEIGNEIENGMNLRHPLIAAPDGFAERAARRELEIGRLEAEGGSLAGRTEALIHGELAHP
jgi:hypothetical protein